MAQIALCMRKLVIFTVITFYKLHANKKYRKTKQQSCILLINKILHKCSIHAICMVIFFNFKSHTHTAKTYYSQKFYHTTENRSFLIKHITTHNLNWEEEKNKHNIQTAILTAKNSVVEKTDFLRAKQHSSKHSDITNKNLYLLGTKYKIFRLLYLKNNKRAYKYTIMYSKCNFL